MASPLRPPDGSRRGTSASGAAHGALDGPPGMAARIIEFGDELRSENVAIGTSELLDAFAAVQEIHWTSQSDFREAMATTLAKSQDDRAVFDQVFDRFFFRAAELAAIREGVGEEGGMDLDGANAEMDLDELRR